MPVDAELALARLAARQHSVFSRSQALDLGVSRKTIERQLSRGLWLPVHRGVFAIAAAAATPEQCMTAACLACGPRACLSHGSAGIVWSFLDPVPVRGFVPEVSVRGVTTRRRPGIVVHRRSKLEVVRKGSFAVTSPRQTLLDLAATSSGDATERILDTARRRRLVELRDFARYLRLPRNLSAPGSGALRAMVAARDPDRAIMSDLETLLFRALRLSRLPLPVPQLHVRTRSGNRYVDFAYPENMIALECDGYAPHASFEAFVADRARRNELEELGWHVLQFTWEQLTRRPWEVAYSVGIALGLRPVRWKRR